MHIPAWVPRLPPNLASAVVLDSRTGMRRKIRNKRLAKQKKLKASITSKVLAAPIHLFVPAPEERKHDCTAHLIGRWGLSTPIKLHPGGRIRHNPCHARQLRRAIALSQRHWVGTALIKPSLWKDERGIAYSPIYPYTAFKYIDALINNISERGRIHDFSDSDDQWCQIWWFFYKAFVKGGNFVAFPDLRLSNFYKLDIYYRVLSDFIPIEAVEKLKPKAEKIWGRPIFMEEPKGMPGVIHICALPDHKPAERPATAVNSYKTTVFHFGTTFKEPVPTPIEIDIMKFVHKTQLFCCGLPGSGKTTLIKQLILDTLGMINHGIVSEGWVFDPVKEANGIDQFKTKQLKFARNREEMLSLMNEVRVDFNFRNKRLKAINKERERNNLTTWTHWPVGKTVIFEGKPELYTAKVIIADEFLGFEPDDIQIFIEWCQRLRSLGFVIFLFSQDFRANSGIKTALLKAIDARMCMRVRDGSISTDFFRLGAGAKCAVDPQQLTPGQFILDLPSHSLDLQYGITKHIPDDYQQAA